MYHVILYAPAQSLYMLNLFICSVYLQNNTSLLHDIISIQLTQLHHYKVFIRLHQLYFKNVLVFIDIIENDSGIQTM